ncbi:MAG: hypothetical protein AB8B95_14775 [Pseudohongiellaceae bacterium]
MQLLSRPPQQNGNETLSAAEYYELNLQLVAAYNAAFEFWLTITFAFLAAAFFAFDRISKSFSNLVLTIYGFAAVLFIFRFSTSVQSVTRLLEDLSSTEIPAPPYAVDPWQGQIIIGGMFFLMIFGSVASIYFAHKRVQSGK